MNNLICFVGREKTAAAAASWQHGVETYAAHHALAGHASGSAAAAAAAAAAMGPHSGHTHPHPHTHPHAAHPHTGHPHSSLAAAAPFYAQNVAMMSSWRAYDGAGFQRASPYGSYFILFLSGVFSSFKIIHFSSVFQFFAPPRLCFAYLVLCAFLSSFFKIPSIFSIVQLKLYVKYKVKFKCVFPYCTFVRVVLFCF